MKSQLGIIEAKKRGENLDKALHQAEGHAKDLDAPLIFASNDGSYCETRYLYSE